VQFFSDDGDPDPTAYRRGIPHLLRQMNSGQFGGRNLDALVAKAASGRTGGEAAAELFLEILSRPHTAEEMQNVASHLKGGKSTTGALRELAWALVMTSEFSLNR
jgi:hypothetical protein